MPTSLKVFTYKLPRHFDPRRDLPPDLELPTRTYEAIADFFANCAGTRDPSEADFFFVPVNLIKHQFANEDPGPELLPRLRHLGERKDHVLVATGDYSQRSKLHHHGEAYLETYDWLDPFILLAPESTSDLIEGQDVGIMPYHPLADEPDAADSDGKRPLLYSFLGTIKHAFLPDSHVRSRLAGLDASAPDVFIGTELDEGTRAMLHPHPAGDDYELVARNSVFTLAPAGYGRFTYRFFQAIRWGSIPVMFSDDYQKPFADWIPYDSFSITVAERDLERIDEILRAVPPDRIRDYQRNLAANQRWFEERGFFELLVRRLEEMTARR